MLGFKLTKQKMSKLMTSRRRVSIFWMWSLRDYIHDAADTPMLIPAPLTGLGEFNKRKQKNL